MESKKEEKIVNGVNIEQLVNTINLINEHPDIVTDSGQI